MGAFVTTCFSPNNRSSLGMRHAVTKSPIYISCDSWLLSLPLVWCSNEVNGQSIELNYWHCKMWSLVERYLHGLICCARAKILNNQNWLLARLFWNLLDILRDYIPLPNYPSSTPFPARNGHSSFTFPVAWILLWEI